MSTKPRKFGTVRSTQQEQARQPRRFGSVGRSAEFQHGTETHHRNDEHFMVNPFVEARYGDQKQLPAPSERRAGPLPYPETYEEALESEAEKRRSQSDY